MKGNVFYIKYPITKRAETISRFLHIEQKVKRPTQHDEESQERDAREPEYSLIASVLYRALLDLISPERAISADAYKWCIAKNKPGRNSFTFDYCCENLNINPVLLRKKVKDLHHFVSNPTGSPKTLDVELFFFRLKCHSKRGAI